MNLQDYADQDLERLKQEGGGSGAPAASPAASSDPMQDPGFRAFVAQRAQQMQELKDAQQAAADRRDSASFKWGNALTAFGGGDLNARYEQAGQPVKDVLARQQASRDITEGAGKDVGLAGDLMKSRLAGESNTPGSPISKAHAMLALHQGLIKPEDVGTYTASMDDTLHKGGTVQAAREKALGELAMDRARLSETHAANTEHARHNKAEELLAGQKDLPSSTVTELESNLAAVKALDDLKAQKGESGVVDKLLSKIGMGDYEQTKNAVAADVAKADSKGRTNPTGAIREKQMLPGAFQGDAGIDQRRKQLFNAAEQRLNVLAAGRVRPEQIAEYRRQLEALRGGSAPEAAAPAGSARPQRTVNGETREWDGKAWVPIGG